MVAGDRMDSNEIDKKYPFAFESLEKNPYLRVCLTKFLAIFR